MSEQKRHARIHDKKEKSTSEQALDPKTRLQIYKLINNEILDSVSGLVSTGKEAVVLHAYGGKLPDRLVPSECALKVSILSCKIMNLCQGHPLIQLFMLLYTCENNKKHGCCILVVYLLFNLL